MDSSFEAEQDEGLDKLEDTVISTKHIALAVNEELDLHTRLIVYVSIFGSFICMLLFIIDLLIKKANLIIKEILKLILPLPSCRITWTNMWMLPTPDYR